MWLETHLYQQIPLLFIIIINLFITFFKKHCKKFVYLKFIVNFTIERYKQKHVEMTQNADNQTFKSNQSHERTSIHRSNHQGNGKSYLS